MKNSHSLMILGLVICPPSKCPTTKVTSFSCLRCSFCRSRRYQPSHLCSIFLPPYYPSMTLMALPLFLFISFIEGIFSGPWRGKRSIVSSFATSRKGRQKEGRQKGLSSRWCKEAGLSSWWCEEGESERWCLPQPSSFVSSTTQCPLPRYSPF